MCCQPMAAFCYMSRCHAQYLPILDFSSLALSTLMFGAPPALPHDSMGLVIPWALMIPWAPTPTAVPVELCLFSCRVA
jgi:hypothetical protein